jgi:hypothetical protein
VRTPAAVKKAPMRPRIAAGYPMLFPGTRPKSETAKAGQGVGEGQERGGCPELANDRVGLDVALRHRLGDEQQTGERCRGGGDYREHIPVCPEHHDGTIDPGALPDLRSRRPRSHQRIVSCVLIPAMGNGWDDDVGSVLGQDG